MEETKTDETSEATLIKMQLLQIICKAIGYTEPYDTERLTEFVFRLQIFFPEMIIQCIYAYEKCLFKFFHDGKLHSMTVNDLGIFAKNANPSKCITESRQEFTLDRIERKADLIASCIQNGIMLLGKPDLNEDCTDYLLLPEFSTWGITRTGCVMRMFFPGKLQQWFLRTADLLILSVLP